MQPHVDDAADDLLDLDVHAVIVQMPADRIERLFGLQPSIHRDEVVGHQEQADGRIGDQPIDQGVAGHAVKRLHQMRQPGAMHGVDAFEQRGRGSRTAGVWMGL